MQAADGWLDALRAALIGEECDQVWFVRDYVMVQLEHRSITCNTDPEIQVGEAIYRFPSAGSRDALCLLIDKTVRGVRELPTGGVEVAFAGDLTLRVMPTEDEPWDFLYVQERTW